MADLYGTILSTFHIIPTWNLITEGGHTTSERQLFILIFFFLLISSNLFHSYKWTIINLTFTGSDYFTLTAYPDTNEPQ